MEHPTCETAETPEHRAQRRVGTLVARRWYIERVMGVGGMASVYKAAHHRNGRVVALKILHSELCGNEEVRQRFFQEAYVANHVGHPGVVKALDDGCLEDGSPFLVLEYLEGETLEELWKRKGSRLSAGEVCQVTVRLLDVLAVAHERGIIHRDLKPENVFLTSNGELKLLDFGIAKMESFNRGQVTQSGAAMGTPAFMPPEQARGRWDEVDQQSDLFAVAASMYTLLSGCLLHEAETSNEALLAAMCQPPRPLLDVAPQVPARLGALVDRGLSFEKERRFECAAAMKEAIVALGEPVSASAPSPVSATVPIRQENASESDIVFQPVVASHTMISAGSLHDAGPKRRMAWAAAFVVVGALGFGLGQVQSTDSGIVPWLTETSRAATDRTVRLWDPSHDDRFSIVANHSISGAAVEPVEETIAIRRRPVLDDQLVEASPLARSVNGLPMESVHEPAESVHEPAESVDEHATSQSRAAATTASASTRPVGESTPFHRVEMSNVRKVLEKDFWPSEPFLSDESLSQEAGADNISREAGTSQDTETFDPLARRE